MAKDEIRLSVCVVWTGWEIKSAGTGPNQLKRGNYFKYELVLKEQWLTN